jgi:preprotein translocase subunit SecF
LIHSAQGTPHLGSSPYVVHYLPPDSEVISITYVRDVMTKGLGKAVSVQSMGQSMDRQFMIRVDSKGDDESSIISDEKIFNVLEEEFGEGEVVILRSDYVDSRFSKNLSDKAGMLLGLTMLIILVYCTFRFKMQYAVGGIIGLIHDIFIMVAFVAWTRMEFNTTTIAAMMTIIGYSLNNTIVVFDRIRETRRLHPDDVLTDILNRALTDTLSRTIITTFTTMLAVIFLFVFTSGSMKDFALLLLVGMTSGVYTTLFIVSGFVNFWEAKKINRGKKKVSAAAITAKA